MMMCLTCVISPGGGGGGGLLSVPRPRHPAKNIIEIPSVGISSFLSLAVLVPTSATVASDINVPLYQRPSYQRPSLKDFSKAALRWRKIAIVLASLRSGVL